MSPDPAASREYDVNARLAACIVAVLDIHWPVAIYDECGHGHTSTSEPGVVDVDDVGLVCSSGFLYMICRACCTSGAGQTEECVDTHGHGQGLHRCPTVAALDAAGEDVGVECAPR